MTIQPPKPGFLRRRSRPSGLVAPRRKSLFLVSISVAFVACFFLVHNAIASSVSLRSSSSSASKSSASSSFSVPAFTLLVTARFDNLGHKQEFLEIIRPVAEYIRTGEPQTLAYEVLQSDKDNLEVVVLERYTDKENAYLTIHKSSPQFLAFRAKLKVMQEKGYVSISGQSFLDSGVGFGDRVAL
ncbi:unnamed protein product [Pseudo-nitzschia multistriata]|uniref:ABM domain-containing protein n=1 Tax=Pseudo-nitzschia multistriata TaxID=183589 RepID=A0A448ZRH6_9STRA|nr:unnamed protein product [Pseudo-nitzschia multistriata]